MNGKKKKVKTHQTPILQRLQGTFSDLKGQGANNSYTGQIDYVHWTLKDKKRNSFSFTSTSSTLETGQSSSVSNDRRHLSTFSSCNYILKLWKFSCLVQRDRAAIVIDLFSNECTQVKIQKYEVCSHRNLEMLATVWKEQNWRDSVLRLQYSTEYQKCIPWDVFLLLQASFICIIRSSRWKWKQEESRY